MSPLQGTAVCFLTHPYLHTHTCPAPTDDEFRSRLDEVLRAHLPMTQGTPEEIQKDLISHFILRIAYCRTCVHATYSMHR